MKKIFVFCFLFVVALAGKAQTPAGTKAGQHLRYKGNIQAGILNGEAKTAFEVQTIHGVQYKTWSAGIGVGLDNYKFRTIPLFFQLNKDILKKPSTPFVFGDIGMQFPWMNEDQQTWWGAKYDYKTGLYANIGAGYKFSLSKKYALVFNAAWSYKKINENFYSYYCDFCVPPVSKPIVNEFSLRRLSLMMGFVF